MKRKIIAVTGARSEYDILSPVLKKIKEDPFFDLSLIVTGSHLKEKFGKTIDYIKKDGFNICSEIDNLVLTDNKIDRIISLGRQIEPLAIALNQEKPDIVLVVGDREEAISVTMTCAYLDIAVAHIAGGDIAKDGNIDNATRYAASKYAHIHFTILEQHKQTLLKLGEDEWRIFNLGNPALDKFLATPQISITDINNQLQTNIPKDFSVLIYHPIITEFNNEKQYAKIIFDALKKTGLYFLISSPNSDAGHESILEEIKKFEQEYKNCYVFKNLDRVVFVNLLRQAKFLIGNSSAGIIEAPSIGLPVINIGNRQKGRFHSNNVQFVEVNETEILSSINNILNNKSIKTEILQKPNPYGEGNTALKIVDVLKSITIDSKLLHKNITY